MAVIFAAPVVPRAFGQSPATAPALAPAQKNDVSSLSAQLNDPQSRPEQRDEAARRLVALHSAEARTVLSDALVTLGQPNIQTAAAKALADELQPDPSLINSLFVALGSNSQKLEEAAAHALANYRSSADVLTRLISFVQDQTVAEPSRREAVRIMGSFVEKKSAELLINLLRAPGESPAMHAAAGDALTEMTGIIEYGPDSDRWSGWWQTNAQRTDNEFRAEWLTRRSARLDQTRSRLNDLTAELERTIRENYLAAAPGTPQKQDLMIRYLRSSQPESRAVGATLVREDAQSNQSVPDGVKQQLRDMIGDSSPKVRIAVARTIAKLNDAASLDLLLGQLAQESDGQVRGALAEALGPIKDPRAVSALVGLLQDSYQSTVIAATDALEQLGPTIRDDDKLAAQTAQALRAALAKLSPTAANSDRREALVRAMVPLRQASLLQDTLYPLLKENRNESPEMRRLALKAIGEIGDPQSAEPIVAAMGDREGVVRLAAVTAMGNLSSAPTYVETLYHMLDDTQESDESVRTQAWRVMESIFPHLTPEQLQDLADRFKSKKPVERRLTVLKALAKELLDQRREDDLATVRQTIGSTLLNEMTAQNDPRVAAEAAEYLKEALDYKLEYRKTHDVPAVVILELVEDRMRSLLLSRQYDDAITFAGESIKLDAHNQQPIGGLIKQEADRLSVNDFQNALDLIQKARAMNPPLSEIYLNQMREIEETIKNRLKERSFTPGSYPQPRSAMLPTTLPNSGSADSR